jgi:probable DNA repair protein
MSLCKNNDLPENFVVLTPNQRLAKIARERFDQEKQAEGKKVWPSLIAMPLQNYALHLSQILVQKGLLKPQLLLNASQIETLWQSIVLDSADANTAIKAWKLSHEWGIDISSPDFLQSDASVLWQQWALRFEDILQKNNWIDTPLLLNQMLNYLNQQNQWDFLPQEILLLGFTDFTPFEKNFLNVLQNRYHITITQTDYSTTPDYCGKKSFDDEEKELETMAQWAYEKSQAGSVACVIPQLGSVKHKISAIFGRYIENKNLLNISLGSHLGEYPLIKSAITGLKLLEDHLSIQTLSDFLLSPFYDKSWSEFSARAILDVQLKSQLQLITPKKTLLEILAKHKIKLYFEKSSDTKITKTYRDWAIFFQDHLNCLGWPGERSLSSEEFQLMNHWNSLLENFASLSIVVKKIHFHTALKKLVNLAHQSLFQPKRSPEAKIDILGTLEATGLPFDHIWIAGMQENAWPSKGLPNPFIPLSIQRKLNMPHSSTDQNLDFCKRMTQQLLSTSKNIIISYSKTDQDNPTRPSLLIQTIPDIDDHVIFPKFLKLAERSLKPFHWEISEDHQASILDTENSTPFGSEIFKDQTACAFRAYAKHRLKAKKIELPQLGFKALTRGNLVHQILEKFFTHIHNYETLCQTANLDMIVFINDIIHDVLNQENIHPTDIFSSAEKKRLEKLLLSWIEVEKKKREPFTVIATEETLKIHFGKLPLHLRIDRIDKIENNQYIIIDYKTGKINFDQHNPMDEPQLPLYCVVSGLNIKSIAFGQLRSGDINFKEFEQQKETWEKSLLEIANDFIQGNATVKPKYGLKTCEYCDLSSLCRIKEKLASNSVITTAHTVIPAV